jgi:hypothetical protein
LRLLFNQLQAFSVSLNLAYASVVIAWNMAENPAHHQQAFGRIGRVTQKKEDIYHYMLHYDYEVLPESLILLMQKHKKFIFSCFYF